MIYYQITVMEWIAFHLLVISSYVMLGFSLSLSDQLDRRGAMVYFILYLGTNLFNHFAFFGKITEYPKEDIALLLPKNPVLKWMVLIILLVPITFPSWIIPQIVAVGTAIIEHTCILLIVFLRVALLISFIGWFIVSETPTQLTVWIIAWVLYTTLAFYRNQGIRKLWHFMLFLPPMLLWRLASTLSSFFARICCCRSNRVRGANNRPIRNIFNIFQEGHQISRVERRNVYDHRNKAIVGILNNWKTKFQPTDGWGGEETWTIWLDLFVEGEDVVQLQWSKEHIFHPGWIKGWGERNTTCPIWRMNFVTMYHWERR
jgi:hypothetical protein